MVEQDFVQKVFSFDLPAFLQGNQELAKKAGAVYRVVLKGDNGGVWTIDLKAGNAMVTAGTGTEPDCTLTMESRDFIDILQGRKTWISAYLEGKIDIAGDMVTVLKIRKMFGKYAG